MRLLIRPPRITNETWLLVAVAATMLLASEFANASLESSLDGLKYKLTGIILPTLSVIGIVFAAFSFFTGNPNAKQHIMYAILGCIFGFGAQALVDFIQSTVR